MDVMEYSCTDTLKVRHFITVALEYFRKGLPDKAEVCVKKANAILSALPDPIVAAEGGGCVMNLEDVQLFAWVGEDEFGSGELGLKQAKCAAGMIPMVAVSLEKMDQDFIREQLHAQGMAFGKCIRLCRFKFDGVVSSVGRGTE